VRLPPFQRLLDEHGTAVYRFVVASVGAGDADDVAQETWIAAMRAYPDLRDTTNLKGWLFTIAHRKAIDAHRARSRRPAPAERLPDQPVTDDLPAARDDDLWARVRDLPEKQRHAVFLRSVADLSYAEVARALGSSQDAARRNVHEGLKRLREEVAA
jgi:RNA polymerase sigma factor (sigma-70 family)